MEQLLTLLLLDTHSIGTIMFRLAQIQLCQLITTPILQTLQPSHQVQRTQVQFIVELEQVCIQLRSRITPLAVRILFPIHYPLLVHMQLSKSRKQIRLFAHQVQMMDR